MVGDRAFGMEVVNVDVHASAGLSASRSALLPQRGFANVHAQPGNYLPAGSDSSNPL